MKHRHLHLVASPRQTERSDIRRLARIALICAARRLQARGIDDPALVQAIADATVAELLDTLSHHVHSGKPSLAGMVCHAVERRIERMTDRTGKAN